MTVFTIPIPPPLCPPATNCRPSASITWPAQNMAENGSGTPVNTCVVGFHSRAEGVEPNSQASHINTSPVFSKAACTATNGQFNSGPHCPITSGVLPVVEAALPADAILPGKVRFELGAVVAA